MINNQQRIIGNESPTGDVIKSPSQKLMADFDNYDKNYKELMPNSKFSDFHIKKTSNKSAKV